LQDDVLVDADHGLIWTRHARVRLIRGPVGKNSRVGGRYMRMRPN
jgi:hypothetical protein